MKFLKLITVLFLFTCLYLKADEINLVGSNLLNQCQIDLSTLDTQQLKIFENLVHQSDLSLDATCQEAATLNEFSENACQKYLDCLKGKNARLSEEKLLKLTKGDFEDYLYNFKKEGEEVTIKGELLANLFDLRIDQYMEDQMLKNYMEKHGVKKFCKEEKENSCEFKQIYEALNLPVARDMWVDNILDTIKNDFDKSFDERAEYFSQLMNVKDGGEFEKSIKKMLSDPQARRELLKNNPYLATMEQDSFKLKMYFEQMSKIKANPKSHREWFAKVEATQAQMMNRELNNGCRNVLSCQSISQELNSLASNKNFHQLTDPDADKLYQETFLAKKTKSLSSKNLKNVFDQIDPTKLTEWNKVEFKLNDKPAKDMSDEIGVKLGYCQVIQKFKLDKNSLSESILNEQNPPNQSAYNQQEFITRLKNASRNSNFVSSKTTDREMENQVDNFLKSPEASTAEVAEVKNSVQKNPGSVESGKSNGVTPPLNANNLNATNLNQSSEELKPTAFPIPSSSMVETPLAVGTATLSNGPLSKGERRTRKNPDNAIRVRRDSIGSNESNPEQIESQMGVPSGNVKANSATTGTTGTTGKSEMTGANNLNSNGNSASSYSIAPTQNTRSISSGVNDLSTGPTANLSASGNSTSTSTISKPAGELKFDVRLPVKAIWNQEYTEQMIKMAIIEQFKANQKEYLVLLEDRAGVGELVKYVVNCPFGKETSLKVEDCKFIKKKIALPTNGSRAISPLPKTNKSTPGYYREYNP